MNLKLVHLFVVFSVLILFTGCSSMFVNERALSLDDIIKMSQAKIGDEVIKSQIDMTHTKFKLKPDDIVILKKAGVSEEVIKYMVESGEYDYDYYGYYPRDYWFDYYYSYGYPYYGYYRPYWRNYNWWPYYRTPGMIGRFYRGYPIYPYGGRDRDYDDSRERNDSDRRPEIQRDQQNRGEERERNYDGSRKRNESNRRPDMKRDERNQDDENRDD